MDGEDLRRIESFAENVDGSQLAAEDSVRVRRLRGAQEALLVTLASERRRRRGFQISGLLTLNNDGSRRLHFLPEHPPPPYFFTPKVHQHFDLKKMLNEMFRG